jgi:two-component system, chemotaxis family, protein-glutamate methylesterase/glutaminase
MSRNLSAGPSQPIRTGVISVLVVDDSALIRRVVTDALREDKDIRIVGTAANGELALGRIEELKPDLVTLDIEMPVLDGLRTLPLLRRRWPRLPVIMFSTLTEAGAVATLSALSLGASDYVAKPSNTGNFAASRRSVQEQLLPRIHALVKYPGAGPAQVPRPGARPPARPAAPHPPAATRPGPFAPGPHPRAGTPAGGGPSDGRPGGATRVDIVAIGCSTGGPEALAKVAAALPATLPVPVVVVQHMPAVFTKMFAQRLDRAVPLSVVEATDGMPLSPGTVYIAPGDHHLEVVKAGASVHTRLHDGPPENFCRPAVDVLFRSVAALYGGGALAVVLTGMGQDGRRGAEKLRAAGVEVIVQDEPTSVVWGMPGAVAGAGLATAVLPLEKIAPQLVSSVARGRGAASTPTTAPKEVAS